MKKLLFLSTLLFTVFTLSSCLKDECKSTQEVNIYEPVYKTLAEMRGEDLKVSESRVLKNPGKIFYSNNTIYISDYGEGVHIIDNSNPSDPKRIAFLEIPGNVDVSFKNNHLIADSYLDLWIIDLSNPIQPQVVSNIEDANKSYYAYSEDKDAYIVDYIIKEDHVKIDCNHPYFGRDYGYYYENVVFADASGGFVPSVGTDFSNGQGAEGGFNNVAGSLSSFAIVGDYFYFINGADVHVYNIEDLKSPFFVDAFNVDWNIETLFPYQDKLFIGGQNGMYIYDNSIPSSPVYMSEFVHARACDPVFVDGNTAYVTLSEGTFCNNFTNQLDVIDITNLFQPKLIKSYSLYRPKGLSHYNNTLFVCDDKAGIKVFDTVDKTELDKNRVGHIAGVTFTEVIHLSETIILGIGPEGLYQYDISDRTQPVLLSHFEILQ